ncbi:hypothetical protein FBZ87_106203 [Nitrospirillum amazonense]|uniref:Uncharacterized protein n=1 Tax=Nitrospirillum amazonense TaxID=28077 RepID=A0A560JN22_9PROT|nr:hypothetical protein [Nitrospirillum amazonense]TWB71959.1 hypothetical protein FBZ87_106203 [Nitrospirillum amazonense]
MRLLLSLALILASTSALAAPPPPAGQANPDWPCHQRLVPQLTAATYWGGPPLPEHVDWRADRRVAAVVQATAPREIPADEGEKALTRFADKVPKGQRPTVYPKVFAGIVEEINSQRAGVITRIQDLAHRQRDMGDLVSKATTELQAIPAETTDPDKQQQRAEIVQRRGYLIRNFEEVERTLRYTCEVPVELEARLGTYARVLNDRLQS